MTEGKAKMAAGGRRSYSYIHNVWMPQATPLAHSCCSLILLQYLPPSVANIIVPGTHYNSYMLIRFEMLSLG